jgi:hypothetical protein
VQGGVYLVLRSQYAQEHGEWQMQKHTSTYHTPSLSRDLPLQGDKHPNRSNRHYACDRSRFGSKDGGTEAKDDREEGRKVKRRDVVVHESWRDTRKEER